MKHYNPRGEYILEVVREKLEALLREGEYFTYGNFSTKGNSGYPASYTPEWLAWRTRLANIMHDIFDEKSAPVKLFNSGNAIQLLGNGSDKFEGAKLYFLESLKAGLGALSNDIFKELKIEKLLIPGSFSNEVFIVHGHDGHSKNELELFLQEIGLNPIVLHRQPDEGLTVIEKFEKHSNVGYAFILLTPDEVAYLAAQESFPDNDRNKEKRSRPNVIFEFGFFIGKLGRSRVCCLYTDDVTLPNDVGGLLYKKFKDRKSVV